MGVILTPKYVIEETTLTAIADSLRNKLSVADSYTPAEMAAAIASIESGGGGESYTFENTILASGVVAAGSTDEINTGVTLGDLRQYKFFSISVAGVSNVQLSNWYTKLDGISLMRVNNVRAGNFLYEFLNAEKTLAMVKSGQYGNHSVWNNFKPDRYSYGALSNGTFSSSVYDLSNIDDTAPIITYPIGATIDVNWCIMGVIK